MADETNQFTFDAAYTASRPPQVRKIQELDNLGDRMTIAADLATMGYLIDVPIDVYGWDPFNTMTLRKSFGYTWVPSALAPGVQIAPGVGQPGTLRPYDPTRPGPNSIKVSLDLADYPPFK